MAVGLDLPFSYAVHGVHHSGSGGLCPVQAMVIAVVYSRAHVSPWTCNSLSLSTGGETPVQRPDAAHLADECKQSQPEFSCRVEMHSENVARCDLYRRD